MRTTRTIVIIGTMTACVAGAGYVIPQANKLMKDRAQLVDASAGASRDLITVQVQPAVLAKDWYSKNSFNGVVKPKRRSELGFERGGRIEVIRVERGDSVEQGDTLAVLNTDTLQVQARKLKADREAAMAGLNEMIAGPRKEVIEAAKATVDELDIQIQLAKTKLERRSRLVNSEALSREDFEMTEAEVKRYQAARTAAQKNFENLRLGTREEKIENQRAVIKSLDETLATIQIELEHSVLKAPYAGRIVERHVDEGYVVGAGTPAFSIIEDQSLQAHFGLPIAQVKELKANDPLDVFVGKYKVPAVLKSIVPQVNDETRTVQVICTLTPGQSDVIPGELAKLDLLRQERSEGIWLKTSSILRGPRGLWECFVIEPLKEEISEPKDPMPAPIDSDSDSDSQVGVTTAAFDAKQADMPSVGADTTQSATSELSILALEPSSANNQSKVRQGIVRRRAIEIQHTEGNKVLVRGVLHENELVVTSGVSRLVVGQKVRFVQAGAE